MLGQIRARYNAALQLDLFEWETTEHEEWFARTTLDALGPESPDLKQSPSTSKNSKKTQQKQKEQQAKSQARNIAVPKPITDDTGLPRAVYTVLEVSHRCYRFRRLGIDV